MKRFSAIVLIVALMALIILPVSIHAQKRRTSTKPRAATPAPTPVADMRPEAAKVIEQIKNVTKFLYIYGKIANSLEFADDQAQRNQVSPAVAAKTKQSKDALVANINGLRVGVDNLAKSFQGNARLQVQYLKISYAAEAAAGAEQLAAAGRYDDAGKALVLVVDRLTEAIMSMRLL